MKTSGFFMLLLMAIIVACGTGQKATNAGQRVEVIAQDSLEYQLIILDAKFETFLAMQPSAEFYSQAYYESWNRQYVTEWNIRHSNPIRYGGFYQTEINYNPNIDYGLDLNYRLYNYFRFIEKEYGIRLINRGR